MIKVVVADDAGETLDAITLLLGTDDRFEVVGTAHDGLEAIQVTEAEQPDVVLLDLAMPNMDGFHAIPEIASRAPETKIIVLSGLPITSEALINKGAYAHLDKLEDLHSVRERLIELTE